MAKTKSNNTVATGRPIGEQSNVKCAIVYNEGTFLLSAHQQLYFAG